MSGLESIDEEIKNKGIADILKEHSRWVLFAASAILLVGFLSLFIWSNEKPYRALYTGLSETDASKIVKELQKSKADYRLDGAGIILVPADKIYSTRLKLAGKNVTPSKTIGFEIFDQGNKFGLSEFTQKINLQRALQGELSRSIEELPQVESARVHLVFSKSSPFKDKERKARASIMIALFGSGQLSKKNVIAIQNLVASSTPNLSASDVSIIDSDGNLLSEPKGGNSDVQEGIKISIEKRLESRITTMLEKIVGDGNAIVRIVADINREYVEQDSTIYNPDEQVLRSSRILDESKTIGTAKGIPGATTSESKTNSGNTNTSQKAKKGDKVLNYEISSTKEKKVIPFGKVTKLYAAIVIGDRIKDGNAIPRSEEELLTLEEIVKGAMGFNEERGDIIKIKSVPLAVAKKDSTKPESSISKDTYFEIARYSLIFIIVLLLAIFLIIPLSKRIKEMGREPDKIEEKEEVVFAPGSETLPKVKKAVDDDGARAVRVVQEWVDQS